MITFEVFLLGLIIVSSFTSLVTEAVKTIFKEYNKKFHANTLAGIVASVLSAAVGIGYFLIAGISFDAQTIACIIALMFMSWLCAMVGYDKVIQVISQFKTSGKE